jgi:predicted SAM-dependent methyltransferase
VAYASDLDAGQILERSVACVVASHVVEHLTDPVKFMHDLQRTLCAGGVLVAALRSGSSLRARLRTSTWHYVDLPNHQWSFTHRGWRTLVSRCGLNCLHLRAGLLVNEFLSVCRKRQ